MKRTSLAFAIGYAIASAEFLVAYGRLPVDALVYDYAPRA